MEYLNLERFVCTNLDGAELLKFKNINKLAIFIN